jgi:small ligand-binding sensory domain FIST
MSPSTASAPRFASALSESTDWREALETVARQALGRLKTTPDLAVLFLSANHAAMAGRIAEAACPLLQTRALVGCSGESIVAMGREIEWSSAMSLWLAALPGVGISPFHLTFASTPDGGSFLGWPDFMLEEWPKETSLIVLADPFSFPADYFLQRMNDDHPGVAVVGGMASGGSAPSDSRLVLGPRAVSDGAVVVAFNGPLALRSVVSQGCRPIGRSFVVTRAERNLIYELGGRPALERLQEVFEELPNREKLLVQQGLHVGRVVSEYQERFEQGDFLVRNVIGIDPDNGSIAIGDYVRAGQTVQFHIRDQTTADEEMRQLLKRGDAQVAAPAGALLFTCNGRGTRLFDRSDHDAGLIREVLGDIPLAGFFAQGEMGPIAGRNFLHGFTASVALFGGREKEGN